MYQFKTGLLKNKIFKLLEIQKNKIKILINDVKFKVNSNNFIISHNVKYNDAKKIYNV